MKARTQPRTCTTRQTPLLRTTTGIPIQDQKGPSGDASAHWAHLAQGLLPALAFFEQPAKNEVL